MVFWPLIAAAVTAPIAGHLLAAPISRRLPQGRRLLSHLWHLITLLLWGGVILLAGRPPSGEGEWSRGLMLFVGAIGFLWVEAVFLVGRMRPRRGRTFAETSAEGAGPPPDLDREADRTGMGGEPDGRLGHELGAPIEGTGERTEAPLSEEAASLLERTRRLAEVPVESLMTLRDDIVYVDGGETVRGALNRMREAGHSRVPVVAGGSLDRILGVVHAKDLIPLSFGPDSNRPVRRHLRRWLRVPVGLSVGELLEEFRRDRVHFGVVGDSLGRTLGVVTLGDLFRYLAGTTPVSDRRPGRGSS